MQIKNDPAGLAHWFSVFCDSNESWNEVAVHMKKKETKSQETNVVWAWLTRARITTLYVDEDVVEAMTKFAKLDSTRWRPNRNAPTCAAAVEYKIAIEDKETLSLLKTEELEITGSAMLDASAGQIALEQLGGDTPMPTPEPIAAPTRLRHVPVVPRVPPLTPSPMTPSPMTNIPGEERELAEPDMFLPGSVQAKAASYEQKLVKKQRDQHARKMEAAAKAKSKAEAKQQERKAIQLEQERVRGLSSSKANRWALGLDKDIGIAQEKARLVLQETRIGESQRADLKIKFDEWVAQLQTLKASMTTGDLSEEDAKKLLVSAPLEVKEFHKFAKNYPALNISGSINKKTSIIQLCVNQYTL